MTTLRLFFIVIAIFGMGEASRLFCQTATLTGTVTSAIDSAPLTGATVLLTLPGQQ